MTSTSSGSWDAMNRFNPAFYGQTVIAPRSSTEIHFYNKGEPYFEFTNFSAHPIRYDNKDYRTSEHLFQSFKFEDRADAEAIRCQPTARGALEEARARSSRVRGGWHTSQLNIQAMEKTLMLKFTQHSDLVTSLLNTGNAVLIEVRPH